MERPAFVLDGEDVVWAQVVDEARRSSAWRTMEAAAREGVACLAADLAAGQRPSRAEVRAVAAQWRTTRRLTAAEDMEAWLERWDLDVPAFLAHVRRTVARQAHPDDATELAAAQRLQDNRLAREVWSTAVFSGALERAARDLAGRMAVRSRLVADGAAEPEDDLDEVVESFRRRVVISPALAEELRTRQLDWIRIDGDLLVLATEEAAREARLCLLDDGSTPAELTATTGTESRRLRRLVGDAPEDERPALLAAQPGGVVGPLPRVGAWELLAVTGRVLPSLDDLDLRRRVEQVVWSRALGREIDEHVTWPTQE